MMPKPFDFQDGKQYGGPEQNQSSAGSSGRAASRQLARRSAIDQRRAARTVRSFVLLERTHVLQKSTAVASPQSGHALLCARAGGV